MSGDNAVKKQRNYLLDFEKGIAAIGVVLVHFQFPGVLGNVLCSIGVCGVILFFLISGYFAYDPDDEAACRKLMKRFRRNLVITLIAVGTYLIITVIEQIAVGTIGEWAEILKDPWLIPRMIILGDFEFIFGDPLWFMLALLYSYLILYLIHRFKVSRYAYYFLPLLLLLRIGMETYTNSYGADWHLSGNFLVGGLPVMLLGHFMAYKKDRIVKIPLRLTCSLAAAAMLLMFVTVNVKLGDLDVSQIFKIWCAFEFFVIALCLPEKKGIPAVGRMGDKYSLYVYLSHYAIGVLMMDIHAHFDAPDWMREWILPVTVIFLSLMFSAVLYSLLRRRKGKVR